MIRTRRQIAAQDEEDVPSAIPPVDSRSRTLRLAMGLLIAALILGLRLISLDSDAYAKLCWSSALLTDEGFYVHNARNLVLFGTQRTDDFNNALIMPTLHFVQIGVFRLFGVGAIQARSISVVCSLLTLLLFWSALCRAFGARTAWLGTLFLGLDHVNLLYNRLALMDTPAALGMVAAFWAFVRATQTPPSSHVIGERNPHAIEERTRECAGEGKSSATKVGWLGLCGVLLVVAYATRGLSALLLPVPFVALWGSGRARSERVWLGKSCLALGVGIMVTLGLYLGSWYLPHRAELQRVNRYYLFNQLMPHGLNGLRQNLTTTLFGDERGYTSYLVRHTPIMFGLAVFGLTTCLLAWKKSARVAAAGSEQTVLSAFGLETQTQCAAAYFIGLWLVLGLFVFGLTRYAPSRYYVLIYPAMATVAALTLNNWRTVWPIVWNSLLTRTLLGGLLTYHIFEAFLHHRSLLTECLLYGCTVGVMVWLWITRSDLIRPAAKSLLALWAIINLVWLGHWLTHLRYDQRDADDWLAKHYAANTVLIGDAAPGLSLRNRFVAVPVIPKLCNDVRSVETYSDRPTAIVILNGKRNEAWWRERYPQTVSPELRTREFAPLLNFEVSVYTVCQKIPALKK